MFDKLNNFLDYITKTPVTSRLEHQIRCRQSLRRFPVSSRPRIIPTRASTTTGGAVHVTRALTSSQSHAKRHQAFTRTCASVWIAPTQESIVYTVETRLLGTCAGTETHKKTSWNEPVCLQKIGSR